MSKKINENINNDEDKSKLDDRQLLIPHVDRIANTLEKFSLRMEESYIKRRFYKHPSFWAAIIAFTGFFGFLFTWWEQLAQINANSIEKQILIIRNYQSDLNRSITSARILIINQSLDCPITDPKKKIELKKLRNLAAGDIVTNTANLRFSVSREVQSYAAGIVQNIYTMSSDQLCKINIEENDAFLKKTQNQINSIINKKIIEKENSTKHFWWKL